MILNVEAKSKNKSTKNCIDVKNDNSYYHVFKNHTRYSYKIFREEFYLWKNFDYVRHDEISMKNNNSKYNYISKSGD